MATKSEIKYFSALKLKKYRKFEKKFLAEGKRLVEEGIKSNFECIRVFVTNHFCNLENNFLNELKTRNIGVDVVKEYEFSKFSSTQNPQGIIAVFKMPENNIIEQSTNFIVGLENISDPGNLGAILRSCDWFGIKSVILSNGCADIYNSKVVRASMGAIFNLNIVENVNLIEALPEFRTDNYKIYYTDMNGQDYRDVNFETKSVVVFCNEAFGPSKELKQVCDGSITIPKKGNIDSLNVAAAAAVILSRIN